VRKGRLEAFSDGVIAIQITIWIAIAIYVSLALMWFVPDRRIESTLGE
jgi:uncharacterized membrane protein